MSDKHLGRIENGGDSGKLQQFSQPWTPQMMTPKLDLSGASNQLPGEFGNFQLVDESGNAPKGDYKPAGKMLQGSAEVRHQAETYAPYGAQTDTVRVPTQYHKPLHANVSETNAGHHQSRPHSQAATELEIVGQTTIPGSYTPDGYKNSETLSTRFKRSDYHEGERFSQVLNVPHEKGKSNYYNGLAQAHFEHGHLYGIPVHMQNGRMTSHLDHEVDIPLQVKR